MKKLTRRTEVPAEPEVIAKILANLEDLFRYYPFVSTTKWEEDGLTAEVRFRKLFGGLSDVFKIRSRYSPSEDTLTIYGEGRRSRLAMVILLRPGFPNTIVKMDAFLDGVSGPIASSFLNDLLKHTSQYLWLKAQDYLAGRLKLEEIPTAPGAVRKVEKIEAPFREAEAKPIIPSAPPTISSAEEGVSKEPSAPPPQPSLTSEEKPPGPEEISKEVAIEEKPSLAKLETIPVDASSIKEISLLLDDVVFMASILLKTRLLARIKSKQPHNIADILKEVTNRADIGECKQLIISLRDSENNVEGKIALDLDKMAIIGAVLSIGNEKYYEVDALSTLASIDKVLDTKVWCLKEPITHS